MAKDKKKSTYKPALNTDCKKYSNPVTGLDRP
jgi:hypothetical protein